MTEQTQDNPFMRMLGAFAPSTAPARIVTGVVALVLPLTIHADGTALTGASLRVNADLLARTVPITVDGRSGTARFSSVLVAGASVLLLTTDGQTYDVICRVVSA